MSAKKIYSKEYKEYREAHVEAKKNLIVAAVMFDRRRQLPGETFDSFVIVIWNFWPGEWEINSERYSLQIVRWASTSTLPREKQTPYRWLSHWCKPNVRSYQGWHASHGRRRPLSGVNKVTTKPVPLKRRTNQKKYKQPPETRDQQDKCGKCGYRAQKPQEKCPAKNEPCNKCNKLGHFA